MLDSNSLRGRPTLLAAAGLLGATAVLLGAPAAPADNSGSAVPDPTPVTSTQLGFRGPGTAIVVLGYGLQPDGTMRPELIHRLRAGFAQALLAPLAPIIVTGGNPRNGVTEADAMADWLIAHGIAPERIHREPDATSTVENAERSARILREIGARDVVVVTSADHIDRAAGDFAAAGVDVIARLTPDQVPNIILPFGIAPFGPTGANHE
ncbi:YdcF family protein [Nocardia sp. NPDC127579]|uniref:YdcF family protein n=1 Tax=Nocardia sp. NPDC127579 TaxID=3345402 RepID=UPI00363C64AD